MTDLRRLHRDPEFALLAEHVWQPQPSRRARHDRLRQSLTRAAIMTACVVIVGAVAAWAWLAAVESIGAGPIATGGML